MKYELVTANATKSETFQQDEVVAAFKARGFTLNGPNNNQSHRTELRGQPKFNGLCGPMWGGVDATGDGVVRYEDWESYEFLSR
jgi:hypothetical protein